MERVNDTLKKKRQSQSLSKVSSIVAIIVMIISFALTLTIMTINYRRTYKNSKNDIIELSKNSSQNNAEQMEMFFTRHVDVLLSASEIVEYGIDSGMTKAEIKELLFGLSNSYGENVYNRYTDEVFTGIYVCVDGELIHAYKTDSDLPTGYNATERPWYIEGINGNGKVVFGEPYYDVYKPDIQVITATKMLADGESVIGMDITLSDMQYAGGDLGISVMVNGNEHNYGYGFIMTDKGIVMAHNEKEEQGKNYGEESSYMYGVYNKIINNIDSDYLEIEIHGISYAVFPQKLSNGWITVTLTDLDDIRTTIADFAKTTLLGTVLIVIIGLTYCFFIFRELLKSQKLTGNLQGALTLAKVDFLTGVGNRTAYEMRVKEFEKNINTLKDKSFVLIMMDLNDLKYINDHYGHSAGDDYIQNSCKLIKNIFEVDVYRFGGDEFALFLTDDYFDNWQEYFNNFQDVVYENNLALAPSVEKPSIAVGTAIHQVGDIVTMEELLRKADTEMYTNKVAIKQSRLDNSTKGRVPDLKLKVMDKQALAFEIQKALKEKQFEIWFQPQVNHENNGSLIGAEALVRWRHPTRGMVSPLEFIPILEYNGLIYELDKYVWENTCSCIRQWLNDGMSPLPISVNVSRLDILEPDFSDVIISYVKKYNIPYELLHLEITESAFADDTGKVAEVVNGLINLGFSIAIDDFGSGYSSLSLLRNVPAHVVKLDMRFFADGKNQVRNECIIESIIKMVKMLGMAVLAEGVEKVEQANLLQTLGCSYVQGYLYSKPLPYNEYVNYVKTTINEVVSGSTKEINKISNNDTIQTQQLFHNIIAGTNDVIIVADNKTRKLLYANHAAEKFYGKRFDPLSPTTCKDYCEKGETCDNCPAMNMAQGEKREIVTKEKGCNIKSLYTQMDWNGHDAVVIYQIDISAELKEMEYANSLIDNIAVGIVVFHGESPNELVPVSCNKHYLKFSGLTDENFRSTLNKENLYSVYPDDISSVRAKFMASFKSGHSLQSYLRVKKSTGEYVWVNMFAGIKRLKNGKFEVYMAFLDAEEEMKNRILESERYENIIELAKKETSESLSIVHFNLTRGTSRSIYRNISVNKNSTFKKGIDEFIKTVSNNVAYEKEKQEFINKFSTTELTENYEKGIFSYQMKLPIVLTNKKVVWCYQVVNIFKNPITNELEAILFLNNEDKHIRMESHYQWLIDVDYDLIGDIDVSSGLVTFNKEPNRRGVSDIGTGAVHFMDNLAYRMSCLVADEYYDDSLKALSFNTILEELKTQTVYTCTFPAKESISGHSGYFQWSFGYVDDSKTVIIFSRKAVDKM